MQYLRSSAVVVTLVLGNLSSALAQSEVTLIAPGGIRGRCRGKFPRQLVW